MKSRNKEPSAMVRMPQDLLDWLRAKARDNRRSVSAEISYRVGQSKLQEQKEPAHAQTA